MRNPVNKELARMRRSSSGSVGEDWGSVSSRPGENPYGEEKQKRRRKLVGTPVISVLSSNDGGDSSGEDLKIQLEGGQRGKWMEPVIPLTAEGAGAAKVSIAIWICSWRTGIMDDLA